MRRRWLVLLAGLYMLFALTQPVAALNDGGGGGGGSSTSASSITQDYQLAKTIALGLSVIAVLTGMTWYAMAVDHPDGRHRASWLLVVSLIAFVAITLDRTVAQGVLGHFGVTPDQLPEFWQ